MMKDHKIHIGNINDQGDHDAVIQLPINFLGNKDELIASAKLKLIELTERKAYEANPVQMIAKSKVGIKPVTDNTVRQKRKRIGE